MVGAKKQNFVAVYMDVVLQVLQLKEISSTKIEGRMIKIYEVSDGVNFFQAILTSDLDSAFSRDIRDHYLINVDLKVEHLHSFIHSFIQAFIH